MLGGAARIPASSGQTIRYRLNRGGDRQLNCALHTIVLTRLQHDPATRAYAARRAAALPRRRRQDPARDQALPEALRRPSPLPHPRSHRPAADGHPNSAPRPRPHPWHLLLTDIESLLAIALGIRACLAGHRVAFRTATEWVAMLADAQRAGRLDDELARLQRIPLLIVDEVGYIPFDAQAANLMFMLVSRR
jgi:hypothetical protein